MEIRFIKNMLLLAVMAVLAAGVNAGHTGKNNKPWHNKNQAEETPVTQIGLFDFDYRNTFAAHLPFPKPV